MTNSAYLRQSAILSVIAFILLMCATAVALLAEHPSGQELFETISDANAYSKTMALASPSLRTILFIDAIFALCYTIAICFAAIGFRHNNPPIASFAAIGIICVMFLDYWENTIMTQSIELIEISGELTLERIIHQSTVSSIKWYGAAAVLFSISFLLPSNSLIEKLLVWGTRIGLAIAVPLFLTNSFGWHDTGQLMILMSMASGFILLSLITWQHSNKQAQQHQ